MDPQLDLFDDRTGDYDLAFILANPIPAICTRGRRPECRNHTEPIHAPSLDNVRCFWCGAYMEPVDEPAYQARLATLWQHRMP